ncbi:MAG: ATP-dependent helicase HrpA, partial [Solirubrobacteraceae bacterium]|nr:ATP-dependent helicase HrpA [Solirubrobacteraceae bacterium]
AAAAAASSRAALPFDDAAWGALRDHVAGHLQDAVQRALAGAVDVLDAAAQARAAMAGPPSDALRPARLDVAAQIGRLTHPGFVTAAGVDRLPDVARYLRGAAYRLERVADNVALDRDRMTTVHELEEGLRGAPANDAARWLLEELRMSYFAQAVGVRGPVSAKRVRALLQ